MHRQSAFLDHSLDPLIITAWCYFLFSSFSLLPQWSTSEWIRRSPWDECPGCGGRTTSALALATALLTYIRAAATIRAREHTQHSIIWKKEVITSFIFSFEECRWKTNSLKSLKYYGQNKNFSMPSAGIPCLISVDQWDVSMKGADQWDCAWCKYNWPWPKRAVLSGLADRFTKAT